MTSRPFAVAASSFFLGSRNRRVGPQDIASTLAAWFGVKPPSGAVGEPLVEVLP